MARKRAPAKPLNPKDGIGMKKLPLHLISPIAIVQECIANYLGNVKYGSWNYRGAGIRYSVYVAALLRHILRWVSGEENDPADDTPHLANARACLAILMEGQYIGNAIDDRPPKVDIAPLIAEMEALMPKIIAKHSHLNPKHWSIADVISKPKPRAARKKSTAKPR